MRIPQAFRLLFVLTSVATPLRAQHDHAALGKVEFRNSGNAAAQAALQRGVALLHHFKYDDAATALREAQQQDPSLAIAYWLEALTYSHLLWSDSTMPCLPVRPGSSGGRLSPGMPTSLRFEVRRRTQGRGPVSCRAVSATRGWLTRRSAGI